MDPLVHYMKYTLLGAVVMIAYSFRLSESFDALMLFVFSGCLFMLFILTIDVIASRKVHYYEPVKQTPGRVPSADLAIKQVKKKQRPERYSVQTRYTNIGKEGQSSLLGKNICIVGLGALGISVAEQCARLGIGKIDMIDPEKITATHVRKEGLYTIKDIDKPKASAAQDKLIDVNRDITIKGHKIDLRRNNEMLINSDLVLDCTNSIKIKDWMTDYCLKRKIPMILSMATLHKGHVIFMKRPWEDVRKKIKPESHKIVLQPNAAFCSSIMTTMALKFLLGQEIEKDVVEFNVWDHKISRRLFN